MRCHQMFKSSNKNAKKVFQICWNLFLSYEFVVETVRFMALLMLHIAQVFPGWEYQSELTGCSLYYNAKMQQYTTGNNLLVAHNIHTSIYDPMKAIKQT